MRTGTTTGTRTRLREQVARRLRGILAEERISAAELARRLGWAQSYMARRYDGRTAIDMDDLDQIAGALGVDPAELLSGRERDTGGCPVPTVRPVRPGRRQVPRPVSAAPVPHPVNPRPAIVRRRPRAASVPARDAA